MGGPGMVATGAVTSTVKVRLADPVLTMVRDVGVPLHEAVTMATANPTRALRNNQKGKIEVGADADFAVLSPDLEVTQTYIGGESVFSKARRA